MERRSRSAVVLLSGGQDSTTALFWAVRKFAVVTAVSVDYGQRHIIELEAAADIAALAGVRHEVFSLPLHALGGSALTSGGGDSHPELPSKVAKPEPIRGTGGFVDDVAGTLPTSYVPGRNALLLVLAASRAAVLSAGTVVIGASQIDYSGYPDCREEFFRAIGPAIDMMLPSSCRPMDIARPFVDMDKADEVRLAQQLGPRAWAALARSVTCYEGQRPGCGRCPACELRAAAFARAGYDDPARDVRRRRLVEAAAFVARNHLVLHDGHTDHRFEGTGYTLESLPDGDFGLLCPGNNLLAPLTAGQVVEQLCIEVGA